MMLSFEVMILDLRCSFPYIHNHFVWCAGRGGSDGSKTPKLIDKLQDVDVAKVYCGAQFSLALTKSGSVYSWGKGDTHRLGHASEEHVRFPKLIEVLQGKTSHSTGLAFSQCEVTRSQSQELTDRHIQNFLIINQLDALISQIYFGRKLYLFQTVPLTIIRSFLLNTQQWYMSYRFCWQLVSRSIFSCLQAVSKTSMTYNIAVCTVKNSWWWTEELSETCRVSFQE